MTLGTLAQFRHFRHLFIITPGIIFALNLLLIGENLKQIQIIILGHGSRIIDIASVLKRVDRQFFQVLFLNFQGIELGQMNIASQFLYSRDGLTGGLVNIFIGQPHCGGNPCISLLAVFHVVCHHCRSDTGITNPMGGIIFSAERFSHAMDGGNIGVAEGNSCQHTAQQHCRPCFQIIAVGYSGSKIGGN